MTSALGRGVLAGAVGTAALTATTYLDMALTGRPASTADRETVAALLRRAGRPVPDGNRLTALAALSGIGTGVTLGVAASLVRAAGLRLPAPLGAVAVGGAAMASTDLTMARLGVSDPRTWTAADWTRDVLPHLAYGIGVRTTMDALDRPRRPEVVPADPVEDEPPVRRRGLLGRSLLLGLAAGGRSSVAYLAAARLAGSPRLTAAAALGFVGEAVVDKLPIVPSRLDPAPLLGRLAAGGVGGAALARHEHAGVVAPVLLGAVGALAGSVLGAAGRDIAANAGWAVPGAVAEDALSLGLAWVAIR